MQSLPPFKGVVTGHSEVGQAFAAFVGTTPQVFALKSVPGTRLLLKSALFTPVPANLTPNIS